MLINNCFFFITILKQNYPVIMFKFLKFVRNMDHNCYLFFLSILFDRDELDDKADEEDVEEDEDELEEEEDEHEDVEAEEDDDDEESSSSLELVSSLLLLPLVSFFSDFFFFFSDSQLPSNSLIGLARVASSCIFNRLLSNSILDSLWTYFLLPLHSYVQCPYSKHFWHRTGCEYPFFLILFPIVIIKFSTKCFFTRLYQLINKTRVLRISFK